MSATLETILMMFPLLLAAAFQADVYCALADAKVLCEANGKVLRGLKLPGRLDRKSSRLTGLEELKE